MKKAEELLISGTKNVIDTAKSVGFVNTAHFCTVFKKIHGISPGDYQRKHLKKEGVF
jgi:AraC-like DNA-binding protein